MAIAAENRPEPATSNQQPGRRRAVIVIKFGGTSVGDVDRVASAIDTILGGIALLGEITMRARDKVMSIGEKLSSVLFAYSMMMRSLPGEFVESEDVIWTNEVFCGASPLMDKTTEEAQ